jgi:hypothetical protein
LQADHFVAERLDAAMTTAHFTLILVAMAKDSPALGGAVCRNECQPGSSDSRPEAVPAASASAMMPMVFCASFVPCMKPIDMALAS